MHHRSHEIWLTMPVLSVATILTAVRLGSDVNLRPGKQPYFYVYIEGMRIGKVTDANVEQIIQQCQALNRKKTRAELRAQAIRTLGHEPIGGFTCDGCDMQNCRWAYDTYNVYGTCLLGK